MWWLVRIFKWMLELHRSTQNSKIAVRYLIVTWPIIIRFQWNKNHSIRYTLLYTKSFDYNLIWMETWPQINFQVKKSSNSFERIWMKAKNGRAEFAYFRPTVMLMRCDRRHGTPLEITSSASFQTCQLEEVGGRAVVCHLRPASAANCHRVRMICIFLAIFFSSSASRRPLTRKKERSNQASRRLSIRRRF